MYMYVHINNSVNGEDPSETDMPDQRHIGDPSETKRLDRIIFGGLSMPHWRPILNQYV